MRKEEIYTFRNKLNELCGKWITALEKNNLKKINILKEKLTKYTEIYKELIGQDKFLSAIDNCQNFLITTPDKNTIKLNKKTILKEAKKCYEEAIIINENEKK